MTPYASDELNRIYDLLFCDAIDLYRVARTDGDSEPWSTLFEIDPDPARLLRMIEDPKLETRPKIFAARILSTKDQPMNRKRIFSVIVEVGTDDGLDVLAAYEDGSARYINYSEKLIVWDTNTAESNGLVADLFLAARTVVDRIGPWEGDRLPPPNVGNVRMSFLVADGLYFGEGPFAVLANDPMGGPVINGAVKLMEFLVERSLAQSA